MADPSLHLSESPSGSSAQPRRPLWQIGLTVAAGLTVGIAFVVAQGASPTTPVGRTSLATPGPTAVEASPTALPTPASAGLSEADAIAGARGAAPHAENWPVRVAKAGPLATVFTPMDEFDWSRERDPSAWIWQVSLGVGEALDSQGTHVFLDFETGEVLWVMNTRG